jgi:dTMP kinase
MIINPGPNPFIVLEGVDGCGKTSLIKGLKKYFNERPKLEKPHFTAEPTTDGEIGKKIRRILDNGGVDESGRKLSREELQSLYIKDRFEHRRGEGQLLKCWPIISDRDWESTLAYYMSYGGDPQWVVDEHERIFREAGRDFFVPDLTLVIDVSAEVAYERQKVMGKKLGFFETDLAKIRRRVDAYRSLPKVLAELVPSMPHNIVFIDGTQSPEAVREDVLAHFRAVFLYKTGIKI